MDRIADFLMDNISNLSSARKIAETLNNNEDKINHKTVNLYMDHLCKAFVFYKVRRYDIRGKNILLQMKNTIFVITHFDLQSLGQEIWITEE